MAFFRKRKKEKEGEADDTSSTESKSRVIKDLKPKNKKARKEPKKPWGRKERFLVLIVIFLTAGTSGVLAMSARSWKLPGLPRLNISSFKMPALFGEEIIILEGRNKNANKARRAVEEFRAITYDLSGVWGFYIVNLKGNYSYGFNEDEIFQAASLIKLPIMVAIYLESEKGNLEIDEYKELLEAMGKRSDNNAQKKIVEDLGRDKLDLYIRQMGMVKTSLEKNETSPYDIGVLFQKLWNNQILRPENKEEMLSFLTGTIFEDWLVAGIPEEVSVAHKYGREVHTVNDAGIIFSEEPFVLVIMSKGVIGREADRVFPMLSRSLYEIEVGE